MFICIFQLKKAQAEGLMLVGFQEGPITFKPTYKFDKHTDVYDTRYHFLNCYLYFVPHPNEISFERQLCTFA